MNTKIEYLYRDASNYKQHNEVVIAGEMTPQDAERIAAHMFEGDGFVPRQVGLPETRIMDYRTDDDHALFEWEIGVDDEGVPFGYTLVEDEPTVDQTVSELVENFEAINSDTAWDLDSWMCDYDYRSYDELMSDVYEGTMGELFGVSPKG